MSKYSMKPYICYISLCLISIGLSNCSTLTNFTSGKNSGQYSARTDNGYDLPAIPYRKIPSQYLRQRVPNMTNQPPGRLVVDTKKHFLYYTEKGGTAMRYGIGVGREGFQWSGNGVIRGKRVWPSWTPTDAMVKRDPLLRGKNKTFPPGISNPLGARALYIYNDKGQDTLYRIHGSPEWWSIGRNVSSGCIRLLNQDIIDLYNRVSIGTPIIVK